MRGESERSWSANRNRNIEAENFVIRMINLKWRAEAWGLDHNHITLDMPITWHSDTVMRDQIIARRELQSKVDNQWIVATPQERGLASERFDQLVDEYYAEQTRLKVKEMSWVKYLHFLWRNPGYLLKNDYERR